MSQFIRSERGIAPTEVGLILSFTAVVLIALFMLFHDTIQAWWVAMLAKLAAF